ncbi:DUF1702 family protein [Nostoc sp. TCL26-01]|uniref:DUF1702 family protein n=1 Tax=Nostoc sp. TCL26-01 TaxID=2576904 RepID=UPI0015BCA9D1|nr:DUF1702 family protein [Nostoc sp. TCL26-01]QLE58163.1 DUF1702 family protein [Nostoc sp. TCL26-01]
MQDNSWQLKINTVLTLLNNTWTERGVRTDDEPMQQRFFQVTNAMWQTHQASLASDDRTVLVNKLNSIETEQFGFALEGIGIGLAQQDLVAPSDKNRVESFVAGTSAAYQTMVYLGVGLMHGKGRLSIAKYLNTNDLVKAWPVIDGYGFQHGMFHWREFLDATANPPAEFSGYTRHIFDQGLGRSIWMVNCADVVRIAQTIGAFPANRQADLWGGIGYACASIGGANRATLAALAAASGSYRFALARAAACAAKFRQLLGNAAGYTTMASQVLSGLETATPDEILNQAPKKLPANIADIDAETWQWYRVYLIADDLATDDLAMLAKVS